MVALLWIEVLRVALLYCGVHLRHEFGRAFRLVSGLNIECSAYSAEQIVDVDCAVCREPDGIELGLELWIRGADLVNVSCWPRDHACSPRCAGWPAPNLLGGVAENDQAVR